MLNRRTLKQLSTWAGFMGVVTIISGSLSALAGLPFFIIGAIPGVVMIVMGVKLWQVKQEADAYLASPQEDLGKLNAVIEHLMLYFKINCIMTIVVLALTLIFILIIIATGAFLSARGPLGYY